MGVTMCHQVGSHAQGWAHVVTRWVSVRACVVLLRAVLVAPGVGGLFSPVLLCRVWCGLSDTAFVLV